MMYVPPYEAILNATGLKKQDVDQSTTVTIPSPLFKFLLSRLVSVSDFDEQRYLAANPDVASGIRSGAVDGPLWHYAGYGYFEGRRGGGAVVDEAWYRRTYEDVAQGITQRKIRSASEHFEVVGAKEWRAPRADVAKETEEWKTAVNRS